MNIEPVDGFNPDQIQEKDRRMKYQDLEQCVKHPGRWFFMGYHSKQAFSGLKSGKTQLPGDKSRFTFKQDMQNVDPLNSSKYGVYVNYK